MALMVKRVFDLQYGGNAFCQPNIQSGDLAIDLRARLARLGAPVLCFRAIPIRYIYVVAVSGRSSEEATFGVNPQSCPGKCHATQTYCWVIDPRSSSVGRVPRGAGNIPPKSIS